jgi:hypothetical protein
MNKILAAPSPTRRRFPEFVLWLTLGALWLTVFGLRFFERGGAFNADTGMYATGLADGLASSSWNYAFGGTTGTLVFGVLLLPIYLLFGSSLLWIKLLGGCFVAAGCGLWAASIRRAWGLQAAVIFFVWTMFPPPFLEWNYHQVWANHTESLFFSGLLLFLFARLPSAPPRFANSLVLGFAAGFAAFFYAENLLLSAAIAIVVVWRWRGPGLRRLLGPATAGFLAGFSPTFFALASRASAGVAVRRDFYVHCWRKWSDLLLHVFPRAAGYPGVVGAALSIVWAAAVLFGVAWAVRDMAGGDGGADQKDWLSRILLLHFAFFTAAYGFIEVEVAAADDFVADGQLYFLLVRYLAAISFTMLALVVNPWRRRVPWNWLIAIPFLAGGFVNVAERIHDTPGPASERLREMRAARGDDYHEYVYDKFRAGWKSDRDGFAAVPKLPRRWRGEGYASLALWLYDQWARTMDCEAAAPREGCRGRGLAEMAIWLRPRDALYAVAGGAGAAEVRQNLVAGWGVALSRECFGGAGKPLDREVLDRRAHAFSDLKNLDQAAGTIFAAGLGYGFEEALAQRRSSARNRNRGRELPASPEQTRLLRSLLPQLDDSEFLLAVLRGAAAAQGERLGSYRLSWRPDYLEFANVLSAWAGDVPAPAGAAARTAVEKGYAEGLAKSLRSDFTRIVVGFEGGEADALREALVAQGLKMRRRGDHPDEYDLEPLD